MSPLCPEGEHPVLIHKRCCDKRYVINERQHIVKEITDGFAKGAYTVRSFRKAQHCIFLNVLRVFKMYFYDNVR